MKTPTIALIAAAALLPALSFAQTPPTPATPPVPAAPAAPPAPGPQGDREKLPKVPVTFLGVETSELPSVVADQLGLANGFGLVVDYVVPDGPAAAAGLQQNDILKMFNDQILTEPDQLSKLIRSLSEGTSITLTVLRKGAETKLTARLGKREVPQRRGGHGPNGGWHFGPNMGDLGEDMQKLKEELGQMQFGNVDADEIREQVREAQREAGRQAREAGREAREQGREARRAAIESAREARDTAREFRFAHGPNGALKTTRIDMDKAQIVYHDEQGELKIERVAGKKVLTAKDPQGRLMFSGPVEAKEELDKLPPEVRQRYEKLEQKDLPAIAPAVTGDDDGDLNADEDDDNDDDADTAEVLNVSDTNCRKSPYRMLSVNRVLI
jgi:hypothetical protein